MCALYQSIILTECGLKDYVITKTQGQHRYRWPVFNLNSRAEENPDLGGIQANFVALLLYCFDLFVVSDNGLGCPDLLILHIAPPIPKI